MVIRIIYCFILKFYPYLKGYLPPPIDEHIHEELEHPQSSTVRHPPSHQYSAGYQPPQYDYLPPILKDEKHPHASYVKPEYEASTPSYLTSTKGKIENNLTLL